MQSIGDQLVYIQMTLPGVRDAMTARPPLKHRRLGRRCGALRRLRASLRAVVFLGGTYRPVPPSNRPCMALDATARSVSLSCGLSGPPAGIPEHLSSSSLPPSFAPGRRTTVFMARGTASRGTPVSFSGVAK